MQIVELLEATAADLFRKLDGLKAMIDDPATTAGEKTTASKLMSKLEARLASEFPGAKKPSTNAPDPMISRDNEFWASVARGAQAEKELKDLKQTDPAAYKKRMQEKLAAMKRRLAAMRRSHVPGNVETARDIADLSRSIDIFIRSEFPDQWEAIQQKRNDSNRRAGERRDQQRTAKQQAGKEEVKKSGLGTWSTQGKAYEPALRALYNALRGTKFRIANFKAVLGAGSTAWKSGPDFLRILYMLPTGAIRTEWNRLDPETQQALRAAIDGMNSSGYNQKGYTPAQKAAILNAMTPYK